jgi:hypothetical protein
VTIIIMRTLPTRRPRPKRKQQMRSRHWIMMTTRILTNQQLLSPRLNRSCRRYNGRPPNHHPAQPYPTRPPVGVAVAATPNRRAAPPHSRTTTTAAADVGVAEAIGEAAVVDEDGVAVVEGAARGRATIHNYNSM